MAKGNLKTIALPAVPNNTCGCLKRFTDQGLKLEVVHKILKEMIKK